MIPVIFYKNIALLIACVFLTMTLAGCLGSSPSTTAGQTGSATTASAFATHATTRTGSVPDKASGTLRLWWSKRQSLNPLLDASASGQAANDLIFEGLFRIDKQQRIQPRLALVLNSQADGLQIQIHLDASRVFHDGSPVTAADVKGCIDFILAHPDLSPFAASLNKIAVVTVVDEHTLQLTLTTADPWLATALTFPVIPAKYLAVNKLELVPGTGPFRMSSYSATAGLLLVKNSETDDPAELRTIRLLEFSSLSEAMQAFESDQIDLVILPPDEYNRYLPRNSMRFEQYSSNQLVFLAYNTKQKHTLSDDARLLFIKRLLTPDAIAAAGAADWGENTAVPLPGSSYLLYEQGAAEPLLEDLGPGKWQANKGKLILLLPENNRYAEKISAMLGMMLDSAGIGWQINRLPVEAYRIALNEGSYDLALMEANMPVEPDPTWLYRDDRPAGYDGLNLIAGEGLADFDLWRQNLAIANNLAADGNQPKPALMARVLYETAARSPWSVLQIRLAAVLYGERVIGQSQPNRYHPYEGIEELWIWSGRSS
jgi:peptide/nickel transport system substrate-binding protein